MLIEGIPIALALLVGRLRGGRIGRIADLKFILPWLALLALAVQAVIINLVDPRTFLFPLFFLGSFLMLSIFLLLNRRVPFFAVMAVGVLLNFLVIAANGGHMPADPRAVSAQTGDERAASERAVNHVVPVTSETRLAFLGDIVPLDLGLPGLRAFLSLGDIVLGVGVFMFIQRAMSVPRMRTARRGKHHAP